MADLPQENHPIFNYSWDMPWKPIAEWYKSTPDYFEAWNVYGPGADEILLRQQGIYGYLRYQLDRHGNVAFLLDNDGLLIEKYTYDAFGRPTVTGGGSGGSPESPRDSSYYSQNFLFQGREYIRELGIYDYRNRFYLPALGRFLQIDPKGFDAGDMNLFRYVGDNPITGSDPMGLSDLSYIPEWDTMTKMGADLRLLRSSRIIVSAHGSSTYAANTNMTRRALGYSRLYGTEIPASMRLTVAQLVRDIKKLDKYTPTMPIKLEMCSAGDVRAAAARGQLSLAQQVANAFGTNPVIANPGLVYSWTGKGNAADITFTANGPPATTNQAPSQHSSGNNNSLGTGNQHRPAYGQGSSLVSTGGGGWATEGYFPGGGLAGEGYHPVTPDKN